MATINGINTIEDNIVIKLQGGMRVCSVRG